jgi:hypothetical protein
MAMTANEGRQLPFQAVHYIRKSITFDAPGLSAGTVECGVLPDGAVVVDTVYKVVTAFNSGTSDTLIVGTADDDNEFLTAIDAQQTAGTAARATTGLGYESSGEVVYAKVTPVGTAADAGEVDVVITYVADNDG